jgi:prevent-host-death family protein
MTDQINMLELRINLTQILKRVENGESLVVTRFGAPVAVIGPAGAGEGSGAKSVAPEAPVEVVPLPDDVDELTALRETRAALVKRYGANHTDVHEITDRINKLSKQQEVR